MSNDEKWGAGHPDKWNRFGTVKVSNAFYPLIFGEHKHSTSENNQYAIVSEHDDPVPFSGYRHLIDLDFRSTNYLKESYLSGDEIRKGGNCAIISDGVQIYEFFFRDIQYALRKAASILDKLGDIAFNYYDADERKSLVGRKIYYHNQPAIITGLIEDQGCVMIKAEDGTKFKFPYMEDDDDDNEIIKDDILSPHIWWWRGDSY